MKSLQKFTAMLLCITMLAVPIYAVNQEENIAYTEMAEQTKQEEIDALCAELNELALEKYKIKSQKTYSLNNTSQISEINSQEVNIDMRLQKLGLEKMDATAPEDVQRLVDMLGPTLSENYAHRGLTVDFTTIEDIAEQLMTVFTVYVYDGTRTINGTEYEYAYMRIIDNKGYNLYTNNMVSANMLNYEPDVVGDLLSYNFEYFVDMAIGSAMDALENVNKWFQYGWLVEWGIGNISTVFNSLNPNASITEWAGTGGIYTATMMSITQMTYYFLYWSPDWVIIGSRANDVEFEIHETLMANVNGSIVDDYRNSEKNFSTGHSWSWYVDNFIENMEPSHHDIGGLALNCMDERVFTYEPIYYRAPLAPLWQW